MERNHRLNELRLLGMAGGVRSASSMITRKLLAKTEGPNMSNWGKKKRERYHELIELKFPPKAAFDIVENFKGEINKFRDYLMDQAEKAQDQENELTGETEDE